ARYGFRCAFPPGADLLVLGHENLGRVAEAPPDTGLTVGDLVVGIVRRPDPEPCPPCGAGEWDMCRNGRYTEHGIKGVHGFARERWRADPDGLVRLDPGAGRRGCPAGAHHDPGQGVGADRADRPARLLAALAAADQAWLGRLITRRVPLADFAKAFN